MSDYWKKKMDELEEQERKKKAVTPKKDYWGQKMDELEKSSSVSSDNDIAPVKEDKKWYEGWFEKGAFADGYQFGDITKTIMGTDYDLQKNVTAGMLGIGEKVVDAGAYLVGGAADLFGADEFAEKTKEFAAKDLYDEKKVAEKILGVTSAPGRFFNAIGEESEENSVFGDKTDSLAESGGQLLATAGLQMVGVPWFLTTGVTSFGSEVENAFNQGATYGQAGGSALISAGAEILTEKLSGGIKFGGKALDDVLTKTLATGISNKALRTMAKFGLDVVGEGSEEVISQVFSNLGSALYKEENLSDIMFSEEAVDGYIESFIGGAALGGVSNASNVVSSKVTGRDTTTGLTANEEKVLNQIYEDRIAEEQKGTKILTDKEKAEIYDEIMEDMKKGYISTDKIESILGGDTYKSYQDTIAKEEAAIEELKTLYSGAELDNAVKDILDNSKRTELQKRLSQEVADLTAKGKDTYLSESYNEVARRKQTYNVDLSKYKTKAAQDTVLRAMESGILNDTRRTHDFVDMIAKISADKGVLFDFTNNAKLKESGFAVDGKSVNGFVTKDGVTLNIDSQKALNSTVGHEITHVLEGTEFYDALQESIFEYAKTKGVYEDMLRNTNDLYKNIDGYKGVDGFENIKKEVVSDLVGDYLFTDPDFINHLSKNRNVFQKIYDEIKYLCKIATAGSKEARELAKVQRAFEKAYQADSKAEGETKYSLSSVEAVKPTSDKWSRTHTTEEAKAIYPNMWNVAAEESEVRNPTQITSTVKSYRKIYDFLKNEGFDGTVLDASSGLGYGTKAGVEEYGFDVDDIEPFPDKGYKPKYTDYSALNKKYDVIISNAVLNVLPQDQRDALAVKMGELLNDGGRMFINVRGKDVESLAKTGKNIHLGNMEWIETVKGSYQKGFTKDELKAYLEDALGDGFTVEKSNMFGAVSVVVTKKGGVKYSLSDSDGNTLTDEQQKYFKDSKMRDENGNLKVMYHGSQDAGFHTFDARFSDDDTSFFFVDRNDVAASYSGTTETYEAQTIKTAEDMNRFLSSIGYDNYKAVETDGKFELLENNEHVAYSDTAQGIYDEFCWYEGVGEGDANYKVYLNLTNPLEVDAKGRPWNKIDAEFSPEVYGKYTSLTAEEKAALTDLAEWEDFSLFNSEIQEATDGDLASAYAKMGEDCNIYDLFSVAADNFSEDSMRENSRKYLKTRDYAQRAKKGGYDGVIFKNIVDNGGYSNGDEGASTVAIAFNSNQIKSVANQKPTEKADIRYSLSEDSEGRKLSEKQSKYFGKSKVVDGNGNLKAVYHGSPADFNTFSLEYLGTNGTNEGYGFYFTDKKQIAEGYSRGENGNGKLFEVYLDIRKPLSDTEVTMTRAQFKKLLVALNEQVDSDGEKLNILSNYGDVEWDGLNNVLNYAMELEYDGNDTDVDIVHSLINGGVDTKTAFDVLRKVTGYDGIIVNEAEWGGDQTIYIAFHPEQIKNVDNLKPTKNHDTRFSISDGNTHGKYNVYGEDVRLEQDIAPVDETVGETAETVGDIAPVYDLSPEAMPVGANETEIAELEARQAEIESEMLAKDQAGDSEGAMKLYEEYAPLMEKIQSLKKQAAEAETQNAERLETLNEAPPEIEAPFYGENEEAKPDDPFEKRDYKAVGNQKQKAYMYENPEVKPFFQAEAEVMLGELQRTTKGERWYNDDLYYETNGERGFFGTKRHTSDDIAYLLDEGRGNGHGYTYAEIEAGLKAIIEDNGKENNACSKRIEFILNDRLLKGYPDMDGLDVPANEDYIRLLHDKEIIEYNDEARKKFFEVADDYAPVAETDEIMVEKPDPDIAPVGEQMKLFDDPKTEKKAEYKPYRAEQKKLFDDSEEEKISKVLVEEPEAPKQKKRTMMNLATDYVDKGTAVENLALKTKNRELQAKYNFMHYSENRAQSYIKNNLKPLLDKINSTGKTQQIFDYAYHLHNIDRMSLDTAENQAKREELRGKYFDGMSDKQIENTAKQWITHKTPKDAAERIKAAREYVDASKTKNKPVFGDPVTADVSRKKVQQYETANPEFIQIGKELAEYNRALRQLMVDNNLISQETADLWAKEYPHYVPIRREGHDGAAVNVPLDSRKTSVNAPIKRATGGNSNIKNLGKTMALRTQQVFRAIARNNFGLELMHTLDSVVDKNDVSVDEVMDAMENHEELIQNGELLKKGENGGAPTFTVFENGKRVEFEITEDLYDSMKPTSPELARTYLSSKAVEAFKKVTTQYSPKFMLSNPIKDAQDIILNSQHPLKTYANLPKAFYELATKGKYFTEYMENGGEQNTYFDGEKKTFKGDEGMLKKIVFGLPRGINMANDFFERAPRLAEYMASRKKGATIETAMLDAARVTTNFSAGGDVTKFMGRNFVPFLNPSVQGAAQQVRNVREAAGDGLSGVLNLAARYAVAGIPILMLNSLLWDDDEEYEELSDYVKENYYVVAKFDDGKFVRIPKGRTVSVIQSAFEQAWNVLKGEEADFASTGKLALSNLAPNNPLDSNILSTWIQIQNNKTWYGEDLVPTRLQDMPKAEQYDESIDLVSKWLGEKLNVSPYHINYLIDQYTGGIGDALLPMLTPETTGGEETLGDYAIAPYKDLFTTDSVMKNQNVSDFYETVDELTKNANSMHATDEDILKSKYMNSISSELGELYKRKREIQSDTTIPAKRKYNLVRDIQKQIDELAKGSLNAYENVRYDGENYAVVGDRYYEWYTPENGDPYWRKLTDDQTVKYLLTKNAKWGERYVTDGDVHYRLDDDGKWVKISSKQLERQNEVTEALGITPDEYWRRTDISVVPMASGEYEYAYENPEKYSLSKAVGGYDAFRKYYTDLYNIKADKDKNGKSISGSRKEKVIAYINNLDADYYEKIILYKSEYNADDTYNYEIIEYLNSRDDISYEDMENILKELGFTVDSKGNITW